MKLISIIIPAYNEEKFIGQLLEKIESVPTEKLGYEKEVIVVDDGSADRTSEVARQFPGVQVIRQEANQGKGAAVRAGVKNSRGDFILIQDADLEYDPEDWIPMLEALNNEDNVSIYGSRVLQSLRNKGWLRLFPGRTNNQSLGPWLAGVFLTSVTLVLYQRWITDTLTAYKLYPANILKNFTIRTSGFETDHEITSKLIRAGVKIREVPVSYQPRSVEEGKKIRPRDGFIAVCTLLRFRVVS